MEENQLESSQCDLCPWEWKLMLLLSKSCLCNLVQHGKEVRSEMDTKHIRWRVQISLLQLFSRLCPISFTIKNKPPRILLYIIFIVSLMKNGISVTVQSRLTSFRVARVETCRKARTRSGFTADFSVFPSSAAVWRLSTASSGAHSTQHCDGAGGGRLDGSGRVPGEERPLSRWVQRFIMIDSDSGPL